MSFSLRFFLILGSVITCFYVLHRIRISKMRTEDSLFWLLFSLILVILGVFPGVAILFAGWIGVQSTANLVYLVIIFMLIVRVFLQDQKIAKLQMQNVEIIQYIALNNYPKINNHD